MSEELLFKIDDNPMVTLKEICSIYYECKSNHDLRNESIIQMVAAISAINEGFNLGIKIPKFTGDFSDPDQRKTYDVLMISLRTLSDSHLNSQKIDDLKRKYLNRIGSTFSYEFSDGDIDRIQTLITELRDVINKDERFSENHKQRLLKRLEELQSELHKRMSNIDRLWGFMGEAGVAIGKFGNDIKPFTDRIQEMLTITWRAQARAEELPSGMQLPFQTRTSNTVEDNENK